MSPIAASALVATIILTAFAASAVSAQAPFSPFIGSWSGTGQVRLENGRSEQIKCKAYFVERLPGMGLALRCASSGSKIDLRVQLTSDGQRVAGTWEERQFNATGSMSGTQAGGKLVLSMDGGGLTASVAVTVVGATQSFIISTDAGTVRGAQISLQRTVDP